MNCTECGKSIAIMTNSLATFDDEDGHYIGEEPICDDCFLRHLHELVGAVAEFFPGTRPLKMLEST